MEKNEAMINSYAASLERMTGKKVVLMGNDVLDECGLFVNGDGTVSDWDFEMIRKEKYFEAKKKD